MIASAVMQRALRVVSSRPRWFTAFVIYLLSTVAYFAFARPGVTATHTPYNHYALMAAGWLQGHLDLGGNPPAYAGNNDFALWHGRWYVVFPPFPAVLLLPWVWLRGSAEQVADGLLSLGLAGLAPAGMFLLLRRIRDLGYCRLGALGCAGLSLLYGFGTVYFFTAVQGTVWFTAHVVASVLTVFYLLVALGAARPGLAGVLLGCALLTRAPLGFAAIFFVFESLRTSRVQGRSWPNWNLAASKMLRFALPMLACVVLYGWYNDARFGSPTEFGYRFLTVAWRVRIAKWGLFDYHYLARNLGVLLTSLPYRTLGEVSPCWQVNLHGLALWVTTPAYLWLLWPRTKTALHAATYAALIAVALPTLFYQNTGWAQFGQRFSNDYAPLLFLLLAIGGFRFGYLFRAAAVWAVAINAWGAWTFGRPEYRSYYWLDPSQRVIYQPD